MHRASMSISGIGFNLTGVMRGTYSAAKQDETLCGIEGKLWEEKKRPFWRRNG